MKFLLFLLLTPAFYVLPHYGSTTEESRTARETNEPSMRTTGSSRTSSLNRPSVPRSTVSSQEIGTGYATRPLAPRSTFGSQEIGTGYETRPSVPRSTIGNPEATTEEEASTTSSY